MDGRDYITPADLKALATSAIAHRLRLHDEEAASDKNAIGEALKVSPPRAERILHLRRLRDGLWSGPDRRLLWKCLVVGISFCASPLAWRPCSPAITCFSSSKVYCSVV